MIAGALATASGADKKSQKDRCATAMVAAAKATPLPPTLGKRTGA